jgi:hypothetical protein
LTPVYLALTVAVYIAVSIVSFFLMPTATFLVFALGNGLFLLDVQRHGPYHCDFQLAPIKVEYEMHCIPTKKRDAVAVIILPFSCIQELEYTGLSNA